MQGNKSVIVIRMVVALLILYAIFGLIRKTLSAPVLGKGGRYTSGIIALDPQRHFSDRRTQHLTRMRKRRRSYEYWYFQISGSRYWRQLYKAALVEIDK